MFEARDIVRLDDEDDERNALIEKSKKRDPDAVLRMLLWGQWRVLKTDKVLPRRKKILAFGKMIAAMQKDVELVIS